MFKEPAVARKSPDQIAKMRKAGRVVAEMHSCIREAIRPGVTTAELDKIGREVIERRGARSNFLNYHGFPAVICTSPNDMIVHGIPGGYRLDEGDIISIDCGAIVDGWHGDAAVSFVIGEPRPDDAQLSEVTRQSMWQGIAAMRIGGRIGDISAAIEGHVRRQPRRYGVVREFTGHGIGSAMHQVPDVPNTGRAGRGPKIVPGLALAIEPMVTLGTDEGVVAEDEWTVCTADGSHAAHWEHTITVTRRGLWVLTALDGGEAELTARGLPFGPLSD